MISRILGRRYAKALLAVSIDRAVSPEDLLLELDQVSVALSGESRFLELLANPKILITERLQAIDRFLDVLNPFPLVRHFLHMLLIKGRFDLLSAIIFEFRFIADSYAGVLRARVFSATTLPKAKTENLRTLLEKRYGKAVVLSCTVDPELIGGLVIRIGSLSFNGSIRSQLKVIHSKLLEEVASS